MGGIIKPIKRLGKSLKKKTNRAVEWATGKRDDRIKAEREIKEQTRKAEEAHQQQMTQIKNKTNHLNLLNNVANNDTEINSTNTDANFNNQNTKLQSYIAGALFSNKNTKLQNYSKSNFNGNC